MADEAMERVISAIGAAVAVHDLDVYEVIYIRCAGRSVPVFPRGRSG